MPFVNEKDEQELDILEAKLELLHRCMQFTKEPPALIELLKAYESDYNTFKRQVCGEALLDEDNAYINALTELRKVLLGS